MFGTAAERCGDRFAIALIVPACTCGSATAACTTSRSTWPEMRSVMAGPAPRYGMNWTFWPVACSNRMPVTAAAAFWLTNVILPGLAFIQATSPFRSSAGKRLLGDHQLRIDGHQPDRVEVLLQVVVQRIDDAADVGVPLADVDGVAVGRGAREPPDRDAAAGAADVFDDHRLAEDRPHPLGHDARDHVGRAARRERHDQRDRTRRVGLRLHAGDAGHERERNRDDEALHAPPLKLIRLVWEDDMRGCRPR